jgi:hypothetical protein
MLDERLAGWLGILPGLAVFYLRLVGRGGKGRARKGRSPLAGTRRPAIPDRAQDRPASTRQHRPTDTHTSLPTYRPNPHHRNDTSGNKALPNWKAPHRPCRYTIRLHHSPHHPTCPHHNATSAGSVRHHIITTAHDYFLLFGAISFLIHQIRRPFILYSSGLFIYYLLAITFLLLGGLGFWRVPWAQTDMDWIGLEWIGSDWIDMICMGWVGYD